MSHLTHDCAGVAVTCMDWRIRDQAGFFRRLRETTNVHTFDLVCLAGGARNLVDPQTRELILRQIEISRQLHHSTKVVLTNHTDCGAYGPGGAREKLIADLRLARAIVLERFPDALVDLILVDVKAGRSSWEAVCEQLTEEAA